MTSQQLNLQCFEVNMIQENCYVVWDETREAVMIDCGAFYPEERQALKNFVHDKGLTLKRLLNTHAHFDHIFGAQFVYDEWGVAIEICKAERDTYEQSVRQMQQFMHRSLPLTLPPVAATFSDGDELPFGQCALQVIATPGHTPGGVCFYAEPQHLLFSGDSLFHGAIGRCDLPGGDEPTLITALQQRVLTLPDEVVVYPGHGEPTTVGEERLRNPYLQY